MKEKKDKKMVIVVQESLYESFKKSCDIEYRTMSEVLRCLMLLYIKEHNESSAQQNKSK